MDAARRTLVARLLAATHTAATAMRRARHAAPPENPDLYRVLFEESTDAMATYGVDGTILTANRALERLVGRPRAELIGRHFGDIVTPATRALIEDRARRGLAGERFSPLFESEMVHRDGRIIPAETRTKFVADGRGGTIGFSASRDISARRQAEQALRDSEERYRRLFLEAEESRGMLNRLYSVGLRLQTTRVLEDQTRAFIEGAHDVLGFDRIYILLASPDGAQLSPAAVHGFDAHPPSLPLTPAAGPFYQAFTSREAVVALSDDDLGRMMPMDAAYRADPRFRSTRFVLVPLRVGDQPIGIAGADNKPSRRPMRPATIEGFSLLGQQLAAVIEEARRHAETQAREQEATKLSEITGELAGSLDVERVLDLIERHALELLGCDASGLLRFDEQRGGLVFVRGLNLDPELKRSTFVRPGEGVSGRAFTERGPVWTRDLRAAAAAAPYSDEAMNRVAQTLAPRALAAAPLIGREEVFGVMAVANFAPHDFSTAEIRLLSTLAHHAAIAIENARIHEQRERRRREAEALAEVGRVLTQSLDPVEVGQRIAESVRELLRARGATLFRRDFDPDVLVLVNAAGALADLPIGSQVPLDAGAVGLALRERRTIVTTDILDDPRFTQPPRMRALVVAYGLYSWIYAPLVVQNRVLGAFGVGDHAGRVFTPDEVTLLEAFGVQAALALQNARLFGEIEAKSRQLEIANRHKSQFLANMSHELRTPLNAVLGYSELIFDGIYGEVPDRVRETLERIDRSGRHLLALINDVLDLSKIEAGQLALALEDYAMSELVATVARTAESLASAKGLAFTTAVAPDLPRGRGDERRLTQVFLNLVGNAIKFTERGGVHIAVSAADGAFDVAVGDSGPGIAPEDRDRIFEEFQQAEASDTRKHGGAGLGLAISKRIVGLHGGRIWVDSTPGHGSTFHVTIPVRVAERA